MTSQQDSTPLKKSFEEIYKNPKVQSAIRVLKWIERWTDLEDAKIISVNSFLGVAEHIGIDRGLLRKILKRFALEQDLIEINFKSKVLYKKCGKNDTLQVIINSTVLDIYNINLKYYSTNKDCFVSKMTHFHFNKNEVTEMNSVNAFLKNNSEQKKVEPEIVKAFRAFEDIYFEKYNRKYKVSRIHQANVTVAKKIIDFCSNCNRGEIEWKKTTPEKFIRFAFDFFYALNQSNGGKPVYFSMLGSPKLITLLVNAHEWINPERFEVVRMPRDIQVDFNRKQFNRLWDSLSEGMRGELDRQKYYEGICAFKGLKDIPYSEICND